MKKQFQQLTRRAQTGLGVTYTAMWYTLILFMLFAMVFDFGRVAYISSVSYNAARVAAQEAAKEVDPNRSVYEQEVFLVTQAVHDRGIDTYNLLTDNVIPAPLAIPDVSSFTTPQGRTFVRVEVKTVAKLAMLNGLLGDLNATLIPPIQLTVEAYAEPSYGIDEELQ
jgi:molecular chaperone DnaK (HSP70)